jgi:anti-sigma factor RsiW
MSRVEFLHDRADARHVFTCPACRADVRISHAWRALAAPELAPRANERFVERVVDALRSDRTRAARWRLWLATAAALLFFFFAGFAHEQAAGSAEPTVEDSYASLSAPSAIGDLLPD